MFFGEYEHTIDDKNRLTLPARFRDALADGVVLRAGSTNVSTSIARADWERWWRPGSRRWTPFPRRREI